MSSSLNASTGMVSSQEIIAMIKYATSSTKFIDEELFETYIAHEKEMLALEAEIDRFPELEVSNTKALLDYTMKLTTLFKETRSGNSSSDPLDITAELNRINSDRIALLKSHLESVKKISKVVKQCATCKRTKQETPLQLCGRCKLVRYCSLDCQKSDWERHKAAECVLKP